MKKILVILSIMLFLSAADKILAADASLFIEPAQGSYHAGDIFSLKIKLNSDGIAINAARAEISFPARLMSVKSISKLGSIFQLWPEEPSFSNTNGTISFGGGLPAPGFNGIGTIAVVNFEAKASGTANFNITDGQILAADGRGTDILSSLLGGTFNFVAAFPVEEKKPAEEKPATTTQPQIIPPPEILVYPKYHTSSQELFYVEGKALPNSTVLLYLKNGENVYKDWQTQSNENGGWIFSTDEIIKSGQYVLITRTKTLVGDLSGFSAGYKVNVNLPGFWIGSWVILYSTLLIILIIFIIFTAIIIFLIILYKLKKSKNRLRKEIMEAKESLEDSFVEMGKVLAKKIEYFDKKPGLNPQERKLRDEIFYLLKNSEEIVSKEINDIKKALGE